MPVIFSDIYSHKNRRPFIARRMIHATLALAIGAGLSGTTTNAQTAEELIAQRAAYDAVRTKSIVELQPFRQETNAILPETNTPVRVISLNPEINSWFLLQIGEDGTRAQKNYHLENPDPAGQVITLSTAPAPAFMINGAPCALWEGDPSQLSEAQDSGLPYAPLCDGRLFLRNQVSGSRTTLERTTDFLRDHVWKGEEVVRFVRDNFFKDSELEISKELAVDGSGQLDQGPRPGLVDGEVADRSVITALHGFALSGTKPGQMTVGLWYPVVGLADVYASAIQPKTISNTILNGPGTTNALDSVELRATDYMVAFDLDEFEIGYALGTDHPALGWSPRPPYSVRVGNMPGPDGVDSPKPLTVLGMVSPALTDRTVATFTAGFKRQHGAFKYGDYATVNFGMHYGFIEQGVILSKLHPNLSTLYVLNDGTIEMKTWQEEDNALLPQIKFARQNGVPLLERDPETGLGIPGDRVSQWGAGNWSGSAEAKLRTLRAGACVQESDDKRFLIYGYFSTATPSVMARTFQAYGCNYAMLLDMNALEHTYLALYVRRDGEVHVEHLIPGMSAVDKSASGGNLIPRFIGFPDNRDLFYVMRREDEQ